ncbi:MAG: AAA family ATPase [Chloroflexi bacterium]|nr:AAA family ATPase [Chloroflexota bacterium]
MTRLNIRLLGGFEVWHGDKPITGFESQRVRALLIYLLMNRESPLSRDQLAGLLWPERDDNTARRNLRQAMYNLRSQLPDEKGAEPLILATNQTVQFNPAADYWLDVAAFEEGIHGRISGKEEVDPHLLAEAVQLYQGDFLSGFFLSESPGFEHWLLYEQERLREMVIQSLRVLVDYHIAREGYRQGIQYASRLLEIDPLSELTHRYLMRLFALSGRRNRALAQYEECRNLLAAELGVEPLAETTALYQAILNQKLPSRQTKAEDSPAQLHVPFAGRRAALAALRRDWNKVVKGKGRLVLIEGEAGIGKSRLVENFLNIVQDGVPVTLLRGRCYQGTEGFAYQPLIGILRAFCAGRWEQVRRAWGGVSPQTQADMVRLIPELNVAIVSPQSGAPGNNREGQLQGIPEKLAVSILEFLNTTLTASKGQTSRFAEPVIMVLEDLHWASETGLEILKYLVSHVAGSEEKRAGSTVPAPIWIVVTYESEGLEHNPALQELLQRLGAVRVNRIFLERLNRQDIGEIATAFVGKTRAVELASFLERESGGLPLAVAQLIDFLCDESILVAEELEGEGEAQPVADRPESAWGRWSLAGPLPVMAQPAPQTLEALILRRIGHLPTSARRLLTLAAVFGQPFDAKMLQEAANEQLVVVEAGVDTWLERRLVQPAEKPGWQMGVGRKDNNQGPYLEFVHPQICQAIYNDVNPKRREIMHKEIAVALERSWGASTMMSCELLAFHYQRAQEWSKAITYLHQAGDKARLILADRTAIEYYRQALEILSRLENGTPGLADKFVRPPEDGGRKGGQERADVENSGGDRAIGDRSASDRPAGDRPTSDRSAGDKLPQDGAYHFSQRRNELNAGISAVLTRLPGEARVGNRPD